MSDSSIGIQTIMPKTGTAQQPPQQQEANARANDNTPPKPAPPPPGLGKLLDKVV